MRIGLKCFPFVRTVIFCEGVSFEEGTLDGPDSEVSGCFVGAVDDHK